MLYLLQTYSLTANFGAKVIQKIKKSIQRLQNKPGK